MKVTYNENTLTLPEGTTVEQARELVKGIYPEVANASAQVDTNGDIRFVVASGTKGADEIRVHYGDDTLTLPVGTSDEEARTLLKGIYPEIANASIQHLENGDMRFVVTSGTKGA